MPTAVADQLDGLGVALGTAMPTSAARELALLPSSAASTGERPLRAAAVASRASAAPPEKASRQPVLPQAQVGPKSSTRMCPMSPAQPSTPR